ncbi:hypothetical protein Vretimale_11148 [Volvox reticuliferus]|uniref:Uncharacterized protein n=1 Tax=Volvox reticuliferus TaxID=1737510 RepID=A0A8J4GGQ9_9CHLO|nr:hypothetical protein Vretifemale_17132 [Volvox reticuliferus]GIM06896.1 hypothetical protein Vretimale_11148 [Volvox reticuliferus]
MSSAPYPIQVVVPQTSKEIPPPSTASSSAPAASPAIASMPASTPSTMLAADPTGLGAAANAVAEEAGIAVAAVAPNASVTNCRHLVATFRLTDLTEAVLAAVLSCPVLELQDAVHAARSCRCLHDAVQCCEELWARLYEQHFGGSSAKDGGKDIRDIRVATSCSSGGGNGRGSGRSSDGKASGASDGEGVHVAGHRVGGSLADGGRPRPLADPMGISRQTSMAEPRADSWISGGSRGGSHGSQHTVIMAPSSAPSRPIHAAVTPQLGSDAGTASRPLDGALLGSVPRVRMATTARHEGTRRCIDGITGGDDVVRSVAATTAVSRATATIVAAAAITTTAGRTSAAATGRGGTVASSGGDDGRGSSGKSWREKFKARYVRESSERRHQRRVALYRYQAAVQEARSELSNARRRISDEARRLEGLQRQVAELDRARQQMAGMRWGTRGNNDQQVRVHRRVC